MDLLKLQYGALFVLLALLLSVMTACAPMVVPQGQTSSVAQESSQSSDDSTTAGAANDATAPTEGVSSAASSEEAAALPKLQLTVGNSSFAVALEDNDTTRALAQTVATQLPMTISMRELNGNEKYYDLSSRLPADSQRVGRIQAGDLMLYGSDCLVLFYESFDTSYSYTRLGRLEDVTGLAEAVGRGDVEVTLEVAA